MRQPPDAVSAYCDDGGAYRRRCQGVTSAHHEVTRGADQQDVARKALRYDVVPSPAKRSSIFLT